MKNILGSLVVIVIFAGAIYFIPKKAVHEEQTTLTNNTDNNLMEVKYLSPRDFPQLPKEIVSTLELRECLIPQSFSAIEPENIISGQFIKKGQTDWAVLCSKEGFSSILVFENQKAGKISVEIDSQSEDIYLQTIDGNKHGYSRKIGVVDEKYINDHYEAYKENDVPVPPPIDHEGINDMYLEKGSRVNYYYEGEWLELQGAD